MSKMDRCVKIVVALTIMTVVIVGMSFGNRTTMVGASAATQDAKFFSSQLKVGDYVNDFGGLVWRVMDNTRQGVLLRADRALPDFANFDNGGKSYRNDNLVVQSNAQSRRDYGTNFWQESSLREYLNGEFLKRFEQNESDAIITRPESQILWWGDATQHRLGSDSTYIDNWTPPNDLQDFVGSTIHDIPSNSHATGCLQNGYTTAYRYTMRDKVFLPDVGLAQELATIGVAGQNALQSLRNANGGHYHRVLEATRMSTVYQDELPSWLRTPNASSAQTGSQVRFCQPGNIMAQENTSTTVGSRQAKSQAAVVPLLWVSPNVTFQNKYEIGGSTRQCNMPIQIGDRTIYGFQGGGNYRVFDGLALGEGAGFGDINVGDYVEEFGGYDWRVVNLDDQGIELRTVRTVMSSPSFDTSRDPEGEYWQDSGTNKWFFNDTINEVDKQTQLGKRHLSGSNNYMTSNIRAWLNNLSPQERLAQFAAQYRPEQQVATELRDWKEDGFLSSFSTQERDLLYPRVQKLSNWWGDNVDNFNITKTANPSGGTVYQVGDFVQASDRLGLESASNNTGLATTDGARSWGPNDSALSKGYDAVNGHYIADLAYLPSILNFGQWHQGSGVIHSSYGVSSNSLRNAKGQGFNIVLNALNKEMHAWSRSADSNGSNGYSGSSVQCADTFGEFYSFAAETVGIGATPMVTLSAKVNLEELGLAQNNLGEIGVFRRFRVGLDNGDTDTTEPTEPTDPTDPDKPGPDMPSRPHPPEITTTTRTLPRGRIDQPYSQLLQGGMIFELDEGSNPLPQGLRLNGDRIIGTPTFDDDSGDTVGLHKFVLKSKKNGHTANILNINLSIDKGILEPAAPYSSQSTQDLDYLLATNSDTLYTAPILTKQQDIDYGKWGFVDVLDSDNVQNLPKLTLGMQQVRCRFALYPDLLPYYELVERDMQLSVGMGISQQPDSLPQDLQAKVGQQVASIELPKKQGQTWQWVRPNVSVGLHGDNKHKAYFNFEGYHPIQVELNISVQRVDQSDQVGTLTLDNIPYGTTLYDLNDMLKAHDTRLVWEDPNYTEVGEITHGEYKTFKAEFETAEAYAKVNVNIQVTPYFVNAKDIHIEDDRTVWFNIPKKKALLPPIEGYYGQPISEIILPTGFRFATENDSSIVGVTGLHGHHIIFDQYGIQRVDFVASIQVKQRQDKPTNWLMATVVSIASVAVLGVVVVVGRRALIRRRDSRDSRF